MLLGKVLLQRYKIIEEIGSGAFGNTYLATDTAFPGEPHRLIASFYRSDLAKVLV
jgi:eukaryotic-like serine/threonine-protein kinase